MYEVFIQQHYLYQKKNPNSEEMSFSPRVKHPIIKSNFVALKQKCLNITESWYDEYVSMTFTYTNPLKLQV